MIDADQIAAARGYGSILDIYPYPANDGKPGTVAICVNDERFDAATVATLDEILGHHPGSGRGLESGSRKHPRAIGRI